MQPESNILIDGKSVVKTHQRLLPRVENAGLEADNGFAVLARTILVSLLSINLAAGLQAQSPIVPPSNQTRSTYSSQGPVEGMGIYRPCTLSEYSEGISDCMPPDARQRSASSNGVFNGFDTYSTVPGIIPTPSNTYGPSEQYDQMGDRYAGAPPLYNQKEPPTEFQKYVQTSIGQLLPIFGASLFEHVPATFAPLDHAPVGMDYTIAPGDGLQISVWGQVNFSRLLFVDRTGEIVVPEAGPIAVEGMNYTQAASMIKSRLLHVYKGFDVSVTLSRLHSIQIFVVGEARRPGSYTVSSLSTLVNAIFASGGPSSRGSMRDIQLRRGDRTVRHFDLYQLLVSGDKSQDAQLCAGDVIFIPAAGPRVAIAGSVGHAGIYEIASGTTLAEGLVLASGVSPMASMDQALIERVAEGSALQVLHVPMSAKGLRTELQNGDVIRLLPIVPRFENAVTLRGNIANPGRFAWKQGMRISDLIPDKESLLTRDYWSARNALGSPEAPANGGTGVNTEEEDTSDGGSDGESRPARPNSKSAVGLSKISATQFGFEEEKPDTHGDASLGAATSPGNVPPVRRFTPRYTVQPAVPEINWEYAVIERTDQSNLTTHTIPFNLGKVILSHDEKQDFELLPGDVVTIFSKADFSVPRSQQLTQVRIEGEVAMAGVYTVLPGETLRQVLRRAGGVTPHAYVYGSQLIRESTRREQQKRYNDFLDNLESQVSEAASNLSSRVTSPQQAATAQTSVTSQHEMVERLRKFSMDGRIVLDMSPTDRGVDAFPNLPLENGDRLYIPSRPSTVNVVGTVYEQSSFLYEEDFRTGDYLKKAGGPTRSADKGHMFIVRADGSVISHHSGSVSFAKTFDSLPMYPGDTLVVPTYINRATFVRSLLDWSQILANFGLGAAAINVLH